MIKKLIVLFSLTVIFLILPVSILAQDTINLQITPRVCGNGGTDGSGCPEPMLSVYPQMKPPETCAPVDQFVQAPATTHYWVEDPQITAQGKSDERARQFIYWVLNNNSIDNHPILKHVWDTTRLIAYFMIVLVVAVMGIGFIVGQRTNFQLNIKLWPSVGKVAAAILYITFSAAIVLFMIQMSELLMKFFIEHLGGKDLFTIYFSDINGVPAGNSEQSYNVFFGCRDLNIRVQEAAHAELFLLKATNITYYVMGVMLLLRKIILWFMLFVAPFLAILMPFVFIRNVGWIWIGVFFQWLFYGPLFALFLGALATIWRAGIPFTFDFSRVNNVAGYVYPTAINIIYGGPAQHGANPIGALNNGNYVDTFTEYIITLVMLWAVIFLPWWLLRIFRDYCCDGIAAMKNILLSMYDQMRGTPSPSPSPTPTPAFLKTALNVQKDINIPVRMKLETIEEIKRTKTEDISRNLNLSVSKLTDIARFETDKVTRENVVKNLNYLSNPLKADTPTERQKYMNLRAELFQRAIKEDHVAKQILSATSTSAVEKVQRREEILKSTPQAVPVTQTVAVKVNLPQEKVSSVNNTILNTISSQNTIIDSIAQTTKISTQSVQQILNTFKQELQSSMKTPVAATNIVERVSKQTGIQKETVMKVISSVSEVMKKNKVISDQVAKQENIKAEQVEQLIDSQIPAIVEPKKHIEETIAIPPTVSIEDYEEVKKMWTQQYERGEVPVTENIGTREEWLNQDIVLITNTLNELMASDPELRQQGLDEIGYILPIFLINNLKGDELLVYLKAKLEAAKQVLDSLTKEKEITEKVTSEQQKEEAFVPEQKTKEQEQTMTLSEEMKIPEEKKPETPNTSSQSVEEKLKNLINEDTSTKK